MVSTLKEMLVQLGHLPRQIGVKTQKNNIKTTTQVIQAMPDCWRSLTVTIEEGINS